MKNAFTIPAVYSKPVFRADRSVKLEFETREVAGVDLAILADLRDTEGWLLFSPNEIQEGEIPSEQADAEYKGKTPAQRLRAVLYLLWKQNGAKGDFESFYRSRIEKLIETLKEKLDD